MPSPVANRPRKVAVRVAVVVYGPDREESSKALARQHGHDVILEPPSLEDNKNCEHSREIRRQFCPNPPAATRGRYLKRLPVEAKREQRSTEHRLPSRHAGASRLDVLCAHAVPMVPQVIDLYRMHGAEHHDTQDEHRPFGGTPRDAKRVVVRVMYLAKTGQEKHERGAERQHVLLVRRRNPRTQEPR